jgi:hypothetical protein
MACVRVEYFGVSSESGLENMGEMGSKEGMNRIQQHEELIDVCFMDMADRSLSLNKMH